MVFKFAFFMQPGLPVPFNRLRQIEAFVQQGLGAKAFLDDVCHHRRNGESFHYSLRPFLIAIMHGLVVFPHNFPSGVFG